MAEKRYTFYSYYDYLNHRDLRNLFDKNYKAIKQISDKKFDDANKLPVKIILEFVSRALCLFQHIPIDKLNSRFDDVFGHNQIQKARLDAYLSDIDISNKSFKITQSEFLINIIYLLFCDRENLTNFKATVFLQNKEDEKLELVNFDYYKVKKNLVRYTDITPKKFLVRFDSNDTKKTLNWTNLFYIVCPKPMLEHLSFYLPEKFQELISYFNTGELSTDVDNLITINTNMILKLFAKQTETQVEVKEAPKEEKIVAEIKPQEVEEVSEAQNNAEEPSLESYIKDNISNINKKPYEILANFKYHKHESSYHDVYVSEDICTWFEEELGDESLHLNDKKYYKAEELIVLPEKFENKKLQDKA